MKGHCKIEVFKDNKLQKVIEKDNLITDAIGQILSPPFPDFWECYNSTKVNPLKNYSPIYKNLLGGIFLFNSQRDASKDHVLPTLQDLKSYIGSCSAQPFTGTTTKTKGVINQNESMEIDGGYKYVWDFNTRALEEGEEEDAVDFTISSLSLTSSAAGAVGLDFDLANDTSYGEIFGRYSSKLDGTSNNPVSFTTTSILTNFPESAQSTNGYLCYMSNDFKIMILGTYSNNTYTLTKYIFKETIGLKNDFTKTTKNIEDYNNWVKELIYTIKPTSLNLSSALSQTIWDNNYIYSVSTKYTKPNLLIDFIKIKVDTMEIEEEKQINIELDVFSSMNSYTIANNHLFINDSGQNKLHCIDLNTSTLKGTISYTRLTLGNTTDAMYISKFTDDIIFLYRGYNPGPMYLIGVDYNDLGNGVMFTNKMSSSSVTSNSNNIRNIMRLGNTSIFIIKSTSSSNEYLNVNIFEGFFASILNFDPITKLKNQTLKITYTITS